MALDKKSRNMLRLMTDAVVDQYQPQKIVLFGSYAYGNQDEDSDVDLLIIKDTSDRFIDRWTEIRKILSDPKRTIGVEPLVLTPKEVSDRLSIGDQFIVEVMEKGETLYVR